MRDRPHPPGFTLLFLLSRHEASHRHHRPAALRLPDPAPGGQRPGFAGRETFNEYSHALISNPLIVPIEIGLLLVFVLHIYKAVRMFAANRAARPVAYQGRRNAGHTSRKSFASSTMIGTGLILLLFVVVHVKQFKFGSFTRRSAPRRSATSIAPRSRSSATRSGCASTWSAPWSSGCTCVTASRAASSPRRRPSALHAPADRRGHGPGGRDRRGPRPHPRLGVSDALSAPNTFTRLQDPRRAARREVGPPPLRTKLVNPANRRKYTIIIVGTGLAGASAASSLGEPATTSMSFCIHDSPRRAHSIAAQGGINAAKNYQNDGDSIQRLFYDTIKGGDYRAAKRTSTGSRRSASASSTSAWRRACRSRVNMADSSTTGPSAARRSRARSTRADRPASSCCSAPISR